MGNGIEDDAQVLAQRVASGEFGSPPPGPSVIGVGLVDPVQAIAQAFAKPGTPAYYNGWLSPATLLGMALRGRGAILISEDFSSGTWNAWQVNSGITGAATVSSGVGNLIRNTSANWNFPDAAYRYRALASADFEVVFDYRKDITSSCELCFSFRTLTDNPVDGLRLWVNTDNTLELREESVQLGIASTIAQTANTWYRVKVRAVGSSVQTRMWPAANPEPTTWSLSVTVAHTAAGNIGFLNNGNSSGTRTIGLDNIVVSTS